MSRSQLQDKDDQSPAKQVNHYQQATPESIYNELKALEALVEEAGRGVRAAGQDAANKEAIYLNLKNETLIQMFAEEEAGEVKKRTVEQRASAYREKHAEERLAWQLAKNEWEASSDYLKSLTTMVSAVQTRVRILEAEWSAAGRAT